MDLNQIIETAAANYRLTPEDIEIVEWDGRAPINDVPALEVVFSLKDDAGPCWHFEERKLGRAGHESVRIARTCRVVLMRVVSLDISIYVQHRHPLTNMALRTDREVAEAMAWLRSSSLRELTANPPKLHQSIAGALRVRLMRELPATIQEARAEVERMISDISQREWCAGWHAEADHRVWAMLSPEYSSDFGVLPTNEVARLIELASIAGGWPMDRGSWVPMDLWMRMHSHWTKAPRDADG